MNQQARCSPYDRAVGWLLPLTAGMTPLIVFFPLRPPEQQAYFLILATLLLSASLGVAWMLEMRPLPGRPTAPILLAIGLGLSAAVSIAVTGQYVFSLKRAMLPLCGFLFLGHLTHHPRRRVVLERATLTLAAISVLLAVYGILQFLGVEFLNYSEHMEKNTVIATIGHPNFLGSVLGPMSFILVGLALTWKRRWARLTALTGIFLLFLCIALARTRAVWLGVACGFLVLLLMTLRYSLRHRLGLRLVATLAGGLAVVGAALVLSLAVVVPAFHRGIDFSERLLSNYEIRSRLYYWNAAIDLERSKPIFGIGFGMFDPSFWPYALDQQRSGKGAFYYDVLPAIAGKTAEHVHNEYLEVFAEQGWVGLTLLVAFLLFFLYFGWLAVMRCADLRQALRMLCYYAALVMTLLDALFGFPWRLPVSLLVFLLIVGSLYELIYPQPAAEPEPPRFA
jgi:O-antigen ligase